MIIDIVGKGSKSDKPYDLVYCYSNTLSELKSYNKLSNITFTLSKALFKEDKKIYFHKLTVSSNSTNLEFNIYDPEINDHIGFDPKLNLAELFFKLYGLMPALDFIVDNAYEKGRRSKELEIKKVLGL